MLGDNIRALRKQRGYSQELLAERLSVVRQTVSKWEKGLSVPDAELLQAIADLFEVPVSDLLGEKIDNDEENLSKINEIAEQLAILNNRIAEQSIRRRKIIRRVVIGVVLAIFILVAVWGFCIVAFNILPRQNAILTTTALECELDGETYCYEITFDENYQIYYAGGDAFIADHVEAEKYDDANILIAQIEDYFTDRGGVCTAIENETQE